MNDIEILEEFIQNYKEVQEKYKDDEIQAEIERSCYFEEVPAQAIENLIQRNKDLEQIEKEHKEENGRLREEIDKKDKIIDKLITELTAVNSGRYEYMDNDRVLGIFTNKVEEDIKEWDSIRNASRNLNINISNISRCCKGKFKTAGGYIWKYKK